MKFRHVFCFGDSWGYGSELNFERGEEPFAKLLANQFNCGLTNLAQPNRSMGLIVRDLAMAAKDIQADDLVLVVLPPDCRWYTEWKTILYRINTFFTDKTDEWFEYHHQLFTFAVCETLDKIGCQYILMHNYGRFPLEKTTYSFSQFHHDRFLSKRSLTELLTDSNLDAEKAPIEIELQQRQFFKGIYFEGCRLHPNQLGHKRIAELIVKKLSTKDQS